MSHQEYNDNFVLYECLFNHVHKYLQNCIKVQTFTALSVNDALNKHVCKCSSVYYLWLMGRTTQANFAVKLFSCFRLKIVYQNLKLNIFINSTWFELPKFLFIVPLLCKFLFSMSLFFILCLFIISFSRNLFDKHVGFV